MSVHSLRKRCDSSFPDDSPLRSLASEISSFAWKKAKARGLLSGSPAPYNLLANGETGGGWVSPTHILPNNLIAWKHAANGFTGPTRRGLALMFDPFVDACLLLETTKQSGPFTTSTTVLVLTDYAPLKNVIAELAVSPGQDWAAIETENFFHARNLGLTGSNLFKALMNMDSIVNVRKAGDVAISKAFTAYSLLIWNYFPFLRGGNYCEGIEGIPDPTNCHWVCYCDDLLGRFLKCVNADRVLFAANQDVKDARKQCGASGIGGFPWKELKHPASGRSHKEMGEWGGELKAALQR